MNDMDETAFAKAVPKAEKETAMALRLAHVENALRALTTGQVDAIVTPDGKAHLLSPAAEEVRQTERRLRALVEGAADIIVTIDRGGGIVFQNRAAARWVGYGMGSLLGRDLFHLVHPDDLLGLYSAFFNVAEEFQEDALVQFRLHHHVGDYREIEATVGKLRGGLASQIVLVCRDISRRKPPALPVAAESPAAPPSSTTSPPE